MEVLGPAGKNIFMRGGRYPGAQYFLVVNGASGADIQIGAVEHAIDDDKDNGGNPFKITQVDHREEGAENHRRDMRNKGRQRGFKGRWDVDSGHIHWTQAGDDDAVGGSETALQSMYIG